MQNKTQIQELVQTVGKYRKIISALINGIGGYDDDLPDWEQLLDGLSHDRDLFLTLFKSKQCGTGVLKFASEEIRDDKEVVMLAVANCGLDLIFASDRLKEDEEVLTAAAGYATELIRSNKKAAMTVLREYPLLLEYASDDLKDDLDVVLLAGERNSDAIKFASSRIRNIFRAMRKI